MQKNNKRKVFCKDCVFIIPGQVGEIGEPCLFPAESTCKAYPKKETDYVTGEIKHIYPSCCQKNKDGCCKKYKLNKPEADKKKLATTLSKYKTLYHPMDWVARNDITGALIEDLLRVIDGRTSCLITKGCDGDTPYDVHTIATDDLMKKTLRVKKYKEKEE